MVKGTTKYPEHILKILRKNRVKREIVNLGSSKSGVAHFSKRDIKDVYNKNIKLSSLTNLPFIFGNESGSLYKKDLTSLERRTIHRYFLTKEKIVKISPYDFHSVHYSVEEIIIIFNILIKGKSTKESIHAYAIATYEGSGNLLVLKKQKIEVNKSEIIHKFSGWDT